MSTPLKIAVMGAAGRMGQMLLREIAAAEDLILSGACEHPGHPWIGRDAGEASNLGTLGIVISDDPLPAIVDSHAVVDFTPPDAVVNHATLCAQAKCAYVVGSTGFTEDHLAKIAAAARHCPVVRAGNMSLGLNLIMALTRQVAEALGDSFDIEIIESHHRHKVDAPSGAALMLGEAAAAGRGAPLSELAERGRDGITGARRGGAIGFHAIRGGDVVGEHEVIFIADGERVALRHIATDRALFARGALRAARWAVGRGAGEYDMRAVLGI